MRVGFICEGVTDIAVLENIFYGLFDEDTIDINELQPPPINYSKPTYERNDRKGGWERLKEHLTTSEFKKELKLHDYLIIQIDSDEVSHVNFNVTNDITKKSDHSDFLKRVEDKLIDWINLSSHLQYEDYKDKIIFCVCIHSIECWILAHLNVKSKDIINCEDKLLRYINSNRTKQYIKDHNSYKELTRSLEENESEIINLAKRSQSFSHFINKILMIRNSLLYPTYIFKRNFDIKLFILNQM